jgi:hypothetical protein
VGITVAVPIEAASDSPISSGQEDDRAAPA